MPTAFRATEFPRAVSTYRYAATVFDRFAYRGAALLIAGLTAAFLIAGIAARYSFPLYDYLQWITDAVAVPLPQVLWVPYNGHRLVFTRLMVWLDVEQIGGASWVISLTSELALVASTGFVLRLFRAFATDGEFKYWVALVALVLFRSMTLTSYTNLMDLHFPLSALLFLLGMMLARQDSMLARPLLLAWSMTAIAVAATLTMTGGLVCWPLFALIHAIQTRRFAGAAIIAAVGVGASYLDLVDLPLGLESNGGSAVSILLGLPVWVIRYMGAAWTFGPIRFDLPGGAVTLAAGFGSAWWLVRGKLVPGSARTCGAYLLWFGLANGVLTSAGRQGQIGQRYCLYGELAQLGLVLMFLPQIRAFVRQFGQHALVKLLVLILVLSSVGTMVHDIRKVASDRRRFEAIHSALLQHVDADLLTEILPLNAAVAATGIDGLAHFHAYGFGKDAP